MLAKVWSAATLGIEAVRIVVEVDAKYGMAKFLIVGLPDTAVREAHARVCSAVYHSGYRGTGFIARGTGDKVEDPKTDDPQEIPWISDIVRILKRNPGIKNIYFELGSTFNQLSASRPDQCLHMLGQMIQVAGVDHVLWGTDSIWGGSPQSQIERLRRLKMTDELRTKHGYAELTDEVKAKIFGLNAAKLFGIDVQAKRQAIKADKLTRLREDYRRDPSPSNTQYGWVWVGDGEPTPPVGL